MEHRAAEAPKRRRVVISPTAVEVAKRWRRRGPDQPAKKPFDLPAFPKKAVPQDGDALMAQDSTITESIAWASAQYIGDAFAEGFTFLGFAFLSVLAQRPEYRVASEEIAAEMTRAWIEIKSTGSDDESKKAKAERIQKLEAALIKFKVREVFRKVAEHDGFFGRGHIYIDTGDTENREELKQSIGCGDDDTSRGKIGKGSLKALRTVEPVWCYPNRYESTDPLKENWFRPETWFVMGKEVHYTRLLTFVGREVPDMLKPAYAFGGLAMSQMLKPYVDNWLRTRQSVSDLLHAFSVMVLKTNMGESTVMAGSELFARIDFFNTMRDNRNTMVIDKETEDFANVSAPIGGLHELQAQSQEHMAAIARIPLVKLLGIQPSGLNASSEGEIRSFYDWIKAYQELLFRAKLYTIFCIIQLSEFGEVDPEITFDFVDLWQMDESEQAANEATKAQTHASYVEMGAVSSGEVRQSVAKDPNSAYAGLDLEDTPPPQPQLPGEGELGMPPGGGQPPPPPGELPPGPEDDAEDNAEVSNWRNRAEALFADQEWLGHWTARAKDLFGVESPSRWSALAAQLFSTSNEPATLLQWVARVDVVRESWSERAKNEIPRNVVIEEPVADTFRAGGSEPMRWLDRRWDQSLQEEAEGAEDAEDADFEESKHPRDRSGKFSRAGEHGQHAEGVRKSEHGEDLPAHIASLRIPPAWTEVHYAHDPNSALLVTGRDAKGREQRIYSERHSGTQAEAKFRRIQELDRKFDQIKAENAQKRREAPDASDALSLIMATGIRPGSARETLAAQKAYGATTLEGRHVVADGDETRLRFVGKKGVAIDIPVQDRRVAKMLRQRAARAGQDGRLFPNLTSGRLLSHVHSLDGGAFKTKDFRTLLGTRMAQSHMKQAPAPKDARSYRKSVMVVAKRVAAALGNTPTIALQSYIAPEVFGAWRMHAHV